MLGLEKEFCNGRYTPFMPLDKEPSEAGDNGKKFHYNNIMHYL